MVNNKGFTLVEILAVIVILGLVMVIVGTKGFGAFDSTKNKIKELNEDVIKEGVNLLMVDIENCNDDIDKELLAIFEVGTCDELNTSINNGVSISLKDLIDNKYVTGSGVEDIANEYDYEIKLKKDDKNLTFEISS